MVRRWPQVVRRPLLDRLAHTRTTGRPCGAFFLPPVFLSESSGPRPAAPGLKPTGPRPGVEDQSAELVRTADREPLDRPNMTTPRDKLISLDHAPGRIDIIAQQLRRALEVIEKEQQVFLHYSPLWPSGQGPGPVVIGSETRAKNRESRRFDRVSRYRAHGIKVQVFRKYLPVFSYGVHSRINMLKFAYILVGSPG